MANRYPPLGFFFEVNFMGSFEGNSMKIAPESRFQSVTGLTVDFQTETVKEGGENRFEHILPVRTKYSPIVLKRGFLVDSILIKWCRDAIDNFDIQPQDVQIKLLHVVRPDPKKPPEKTEPLVTWKVINAWPKKWSISEFNAENNSIAIETLELNFQYFKQL